MINRIRVVTLLVMVLGVFALLQLISGSLFFSSLHHSQKSFVVSNQLREQQGELTSTWDLMLQTRINLSRSAVRMMMDSSNQQSNAKVELLDSARKTLAQAATHYKKFKSMAPLPEMVATSRNIDEKYKNYHTALTELIDYLADREEDRLCRIRQEFQVIAAFCRELRTGYARIPIPVVLHQILGAYDPAVGFWGVSGNGKSGIIIQGGL